MCIRDRFSSDDSSAEDTYAVWLGESALNITLTPASFVTIVTAIIAVVVSLLTTLLSLSSSLSLLEDNSYMLSLSDDSLSSCSSDDLSEDTYTPSSDVSSEDAFTTLLSTMIA